MTSKKIWLALPALLAANTIFAGSLNNGVWTSNGCGEQPSIPEMDASSIDAYNFSAGEFNAWQRSVALAYKECLAKEATMDNAAIAGSANEQQNAFNDLIEVAKTRAAEIKSLLEAQ